MHIRRLELHGFKSFKDKTVINFDDGITGIVGPNGCGKSNVVDAFFWVMGEQNARHLRGQNMDDLIFSGADKAPPASSAEVTLVLEMPAELSGPNAPAGASSGDLTTHPTREVAITRKLYRTGESDYFLNKTPCRLRDIQELFMDTGVGARGYSIIQQGQIQKIVQAKPEDRRQMIEEVAGIVKYKVRRKESMRKLEGTQQNLLRVTDVINELEAQKRQMERQADKARKYKEWKERLQSIELRFNALKWEDLNNRVTHLESDIETLGAEDANLSAARETAETQISQKRIELAQASKITEEFQQKWIEAGTKLNNAENDLRYSQKTLDDLQATFAQLERDTQEERTLVESLTEQNQALLDESSTIEAQYTEAEDTRKTQELLAQERRGEAEETERLLEGTKSRLYEIASELERARSTANFAEQRIRELNETLARIGQDRAERQEFVAAALTEKETASERLSVARAEGDALRSGIHTISEEISHKNKELHEARRELARMNSEQARMRTTLHTLEEQKLRHEDSSKGVKAVFQQILPNRADLAEGVRGTLADMLSVDSGMETAAETALGRSLDWVLTNDSQLHAALGAALKEGSLGRAAFADLRKLEAQNQNGAAEFAAPAEFAGDVAGPLSNFVRLQSTVTETGAAALLNHLLAKVIVLRSSANAMAISEQFPDFTFVSQEGETFRSGWFMEGGDKSSVSGHYVGRNREIAELTEKVQEIAGQIEALQNKIHGIEASIQESELARRTSEEKIRAQQTGISQLVNEEASLSARLHEAERALAKMLQEEERAQGELEKLSASEKEARAKILSFETEKGGLEAETGRLAEVLATARAAWDSAQQTLVDARVKAANLADQKSSLETRKRQNQNALDQHRNRIESMLEQAKRRIQESEGTQAHIATLSVKIEELRTDLVNTEQEYRSARDRFDLINNEVEEQRSAAQEHANRERAIKDRLLEARLEHQKVASDRDILSQDTFERYGLMLNEYCYMPETIEQVQLLRESGEAMIAEIKNEVTLLREKIRKLGDVNPAAVEEYEAIVDRFNLLSTQRADLEKAMNDLQSTVDRINKVSKERFERAFHQTNEHFKRVFPVIFGGGHAQLTLTNPEDMLETGVDIMAQPPGKKAQNINLLSGGEKTLTALSLLFSIFLVKPSPFCLLDEVDAPLDDANIGRFNALLREMSKRSQFIIITHNKRTMELNDKLYGVTMEDAGMSKMVSIQLSTSA